ncbi:MAG: NAD(P)H-dependent oxidoreductase subunit E [candidate division Zixibacteria bacterium]|nr:NAD(P)H-dependent oxidoreductase subunit E [candidate division Zixibacteria bacterium]
MQETARKLLNKESMARLKKLEVEYPDKQSVVLSVLHVIYDQFGYLDKEAVEEAAGLMSIPKVYFEEAATFYTMFPLEPRGKYLIQVCQNICCTLMGAEELIDYLKEKLNIDMGETSKDKMFSLVVVECLGACGGAPMLQINDLYYEYLTRAKVDEILENLRNS